ESPKEERPHTDPPQADDPQAERGEHPAELALPARPQHDPNDGSAAAARQHRDTLRGRDSLLETDASAQRGERRRGDRVGEEHFVLAIVSVAWVNDPLGPRAVVGEEEKSFRVRVKPPDRIQALARSEKLDDRPAAAFVAGRRVDAAR